ncbi:MAG: hypothetical protein U0269_08585 [Polyangiales bacterium]
MFVLVDLSGSPLLCARCATPITAMALRRYRRPAHYHIDCAIDVDAELARSTLDDAQTSFEGLEALASLARARCAARADANRLTKKHKNLEPVEPARDRQGRPRVRVVCWHSTEGSTRAPGRGCFDSSTFGEDSTLTSSIREYVFVAHRKSADLRIDPSQPWVAGAYWQDASARVSPGNPKLVEWKALSLPSPVLVIVGSEAEDQSKCDALAIRLRALVEKSGFNPDECPVVCGTRDDEAFRERLRLALDAQSTNVSSSTVERKHERVGETLDALIDEGRAEAIVLAVSTAAKAYRSARVPEKARTLAAIERALVAHPELADKVLTPLTRSRVPLPRERIAAIIAAMIAMPTLPARLEDWLRLWRDSLGETDGLRAAIRAQIDADPSSVKAEGLRAAMARVRLAIDL